MSPSEPAPAAEFPNRLRSPEPLREKSPLRWRWMLLLFGLCLIPRAWMAMRMEIPCPDSLFFIRLAQAQEKGEALESAGAYSHNIYPLILAGLHRLGIDHQTAGEWWGVLAGSLAVLPLFGWLRRMHGERVAILACILYSFHPRLIEWSTEIIRESTFWLLLTTAVYLLWRALEEVRIVWFALAGLAVALALHTRFEGWFLLAPLAGWSLVRFCSLHRGRLKLSLGLAAHAAVYPAVFGGVAMLSGQGDGSFDEQHRFRMVQEFVAAADGDPGGDEARGPTLELRPVAYHGGWAGVPAAALTSFDDAEANQRASTAETPPLTRWRAAYILQKTIARALSPGFAVLMLLGAVVRWRVLLRGDVLPLAGFALAVTAGAWVHLWKAGESSDRYFLSIVILALPLAVFGATRIGQWFAAISLRRRPRADMAPSVLLAERRAVAVMVVLLACGAAGWADALTFKDQGRIERADLGRWVRENLGSGRQIVGSHQWASMSYFAQGDYRLIPETPAGRKNIGLVAFLQRRQPDVVVLSRMWTPPQQVSRVLQARRQLGLQLVPAEYLPDSCRQMVIVLVRPPAVSTARRPVWEVGF